LLRCVETNSVAAVDGPEYKPVADYCGDRGWTLGAIFNTHTHPDHIGINKDLGPLLDQMRVVGSAKRMAGSTGRFSERPASN
jgi:glyoxylase-like metal-dependent hydrolase (beta-lactamase superfamily II)